MTITHDDFTGYTSGDLNGQGGWNKGDGLINVYTGGTYAEVMQHSHDYDLTLAKAYPNNTRLLFSGNFYFFSDYAIVELIFGLSNSSFIYAGSCMIIQAYLGNIYICCGSYGNPMQNYIYYGTYNDSENTNIEYIVDGATGIFEYISITNPNVRVGPKSGQAANHGIDILHIEHAGKTGMYDIHRFNNIYIDDMILDSKKYLKYPRWQPTRYGMRPFY